MLDLVAHDTPRLSMMALRPHAVLGERPVLALEPLHQHQRPADVLDLAVVLERPHVGDQVSDLVLQFVQPVREELRRPPIRLVLAALQPFALFLRWLVVVLAHVTSSSAARCSDRARTRVVDRMNRSVSFKDARTLAVRNQLTEKDVTYLDKASSAFSTRAARTFPPAPPGSATPTSAPAAGIP